ncbi:MAG: saccharopine dehydrogenase C-terminal domain-containing protein [Desulfosarcina sp.]
MKVLVLGMGLQGKAVVHDLEQSTLVTDILVADLNPDRVQAWLDQRGYTKSRGVGLNAADSDQLERHVAQSGARIVVCMLPPDFGYRVAQVALKNGIHFVSSSYTGRLAELDAAARNRNVTILPEMGMDPGIDLVLARLAIDELDTVEGLYSYGGGLPEPAYAGDNPLMYKITWTFDGVLKAYKRPARILRAGETIDIPGEHIFREEHGHTISVRGIGSLEAYPNGDAIHYIDVFQLGSAITDMGRFALRYPGHRCFWRTMAELGFLDDQPLGDTLNLSPRRFLVEHLTPRLQFKSHERDMVIVRIRAWGVKDGKKRTVTYDLIDYRDLEHGFFAMNRTVGFTTSIGAHLILDGTIRTPGVLSPTRHVPPRRLLDELKKRGMHIEHRVEFTEVA